MNTLIRILTLAALAVFVARLLWRFVTAAFLAYFYNDDGSSQKGWPTDGY